MMGLTFEARTFPGHVVGRGVGGMRWEELDKLKLIKDGFSKSRRCLTLKWGMRLRPILRGHPVQVL